MAGKTRFSRKSRRRNNAIEGGDPLGDRPTKKEGRASRRPNYRWRPEITGNSQERIGSKFGQTSSRGGRMERGGP